MKRFLFIIVIAALSLAISPVSPSPNPVRAQDGAAPHVVCVPFHGTMALVPHDTWIGKEITFKGTAHDADGDNTMSQFRWSFGDGYSAGWVSGVSAYAIEARHTYTGEMADGTPYGNGKYFTASLEVKDSDGLVGQDTYFVIIGEGTPELRANVAIDEGLWWLHKLQVRGTYAGNVPYGYWVGGHPVSNTGAVTEAFEVQGHLPSGNVNEDPYVETVQRGLNYLLANTQVHPISAQLYGNPDGNGNGIGLGCYGDSQRTMYECGITLMTLAGSIDPNRIAETGDATWVKGRAYKDIVQDMVDYLAFGQTDSGAGRGGWRYYANYGDTDNSCSQWPAIGLQAAELNFGSYGVVIPAFVKSELEIWLNASQNPDGGFLYAFSGDWTQKTSNVARTGAGCAMMAFAGITPADARFNAALSYLDTHWNATTGPMGVWDNHFGSYYAMYGVMKGMRLPEPDIVLIGSHDWYTEYRDYIVNHQNGDASWTATIPDHNPYLGSAWALLTLIKTVEKPGPIAVAGMDMLYCPPLVAVKFDASHSYHRNPTKQIVLYEWDFESDGTWDYWSTSESQTAEHSYPAIYVGDDIDWDATSKNYTVTLRVTDNSEPQMTDTDTCLVGITPPPWPPVSDPNGPYHALPGKTIKLDGSGSYDPEERMYAEGDPWYETIATYEWDLNNDGLFDDSTAIQPEFTAPTSYGTYSVGLRVTDSNPSGPGGNYTEQDWSIKYTTLLVASGPPVAEANGPYEIVEGNVTFSISGSFDPEGDPLEYRWDFESDGTWNTQWLSRQTQGDESVHSYNQTAEYVATLEVKDSEGLTSSDTAAVHGGPVWFTWTCPSEAEMDSDYNIVLRAENKASSSQNITVWIAENSESPHMISGLDCNAGTLQRNVQDNQWLQFRGQNYTSGTPIHETLAVNETKEFVFAVKHKWNWIATWSVCRLLFGAAQIAISVYLPVVAETRPVTSLTPLIASLAFSLGFKQCLNWFGGMQYGRVYAYALGADHLVWNTKVTLGVPEWKWSALTSSMVAGWLGGKATAIGILLGGFPAGIPAFVLEGVSIITSEALYVGAADPPEDYTIIPVPEEVAVPGTEVVTDPEERAIIDEAVQLAATMQAAQHAGTRAELALDAGSEYWHSIQLFYYKKYLQDSAALLQDLSALMEGHLEGVSPPTAPMIAEMREQLATMGLPEIEEATLAAFGFSPEDIQAVEDSLPSMPEVYFRSSTEIPLMLSNLADALLEIAGRLPSNPPAPPMPMVPTMDKWGVVAMITLFAGLLVWMVCKRRFTS